MSIFCVVSRFERIIKRTDKVLHAVYIRAKVMYKMNSLTAIKTLKCDSKVSDNLQLVMMSRHQAAKDILADFYAEYRKIRRSGRKCTTGY